VKGSRRRDPVTGARNFELAGAEFHQKFYRSSLAAPLGIALAAEVSYTSAVGAAFEVSVDIKTAKKLTQLYSLKAKLLQKLANHSAKVVRRTAELKELNEQLCACEREAAASE